MNPKSLANLKKRVYDSEWTYREKLGMTPTHASTRVARPIPLGIEEQNQLVNEMYEWVVNNPDEISLDLWCVNNGFRPYYFYKIRDSNEYFANVLYMSVSLIMARMSKEVWHNRGNERLYHNMLRMWHENYKETINEEVAHRVAQSLIAKHEAQTNTQLRIVDVELERIPHTEAVTQSLEKDGNSKRERRRNEGMATQVPAETVPVALDGRD